MLKSITYTATILALGALTTLGCATKSADTHEYIANAMIPDADPQPEFEDDSVHDHPNATSTLYIEVANINPEFAAMMREAGVEDELSRGDTLYTVFVPNPDVFVPSMLDGDGDDAERRRLLGYYVVPGRLTSSELTNMKQAPTITGQPVDILTDEPGTFFAVNQARVLRPNIPATNGIVHEIDTMLLPPDHPDAPGLRDESPTAFVRVDVTIANACELRQPRAFFAFDSATLRPSAHDSLQDLATCMTTGPLAGQRLEIEGYTDPRGTAAYNKTLGRERAEAVKGYLVDKGVLAKQVKVRSHGEKHAHDEQPAFWDFDRRVDINLAAELTR